MTGTNAGADAPSGLAALPAGSARSRLIGRVRLVLRLLALALGAAHAAAAALSQSMNEDGIDYLDLGAALVAGDWAQAINGIWSPLYALVLGLAVGVLDPSAWWEFPLVQGVNFVVYVLALLAFEFFWQTLTERYYRADGGQVAVMHPLAWLILGYSLFIYASLNLIEMWAVTPDMAVAAFVYLGAGVALRLMDGPARLGRMAGFGVILGFGYLAKAVLFPLGLAAILLLALVAPRPVYGLRGALLSLAGMLAIAGPWAGLVSWQAGHPTFSEVSGFTYMKHVNGLDYPFWGESVERVAGTAVHPPRQVSEDPAAYTFSGPVGGTYPLSYDPAYWTEGLEPVLDPARQFAAIVANGAWYFDLFFRQLGGVTALVLLLLLLTLERGRQALSRPAALLVSWACLAFGLYALVLAEARYLAPFLVLLCAGLLLAARPRGGPGRAGLLNAAGGLIAVFLWANIAAQNLAGVAGLAGLPAPAGAVPGEFRDGPAVSHPLLATELHALGLEPGTRIAVIGHGFAAYWARLARLRIVAELPSGHEEAFWRADPARRSELLHALGSAGARVVIAEPAPAGAGTAGWRRIGETGYLIRGLLMTDLPRIGEPDAGQPTERE